MRALILIFVLIYSTTTAEAGKGVEVGAWALFKGTTMAGPQSIEMTQKYAIVGQEKDAEGNLLLWFETDASMSGNRMLTKVLVPTTDFEQGNVSPSGFYENARRLIVKMGDQPAMEMPIKQAMQQAQSLFGLPDDPGAKVTDLGEEVMETSKGKIRCAKKQYQGKVSMEQTQGPMAMTMHQYL